MVAFIVTKNPADVASDMRKLFGKDSVYIVTCFKPNKRRLEKAEYIFATSIQNYKRHEALLKKKKVIIFDCPLDIKDFDNAPILDMGRIKSYEWAANNFIGKDINLQNIDGSISKRKLVETKDSSYIHDIIEEYMTSSVIDKTHTFVYMCTNARNRTKVRYWLACYIANMCSKKELLEFLDSLKLKNKEESFKLLAKVFEYVESEEGKNFSKACIGAYEEQNNGGIPYTKVAEKMGVDKFDLKTVLLGLDLEKKIEE